jgi:hypothetical protein
MSSEHEGQRAGHISYGDEHYYSYIIKHITYPCIIIILYSSNYLVHITTLARTIYPAETICSINSTQTIQLPCIGLHHIPLRL